MARIKQNDSLRIAFVNWSWETVGSLILLNIKGSCGVVILEVCFEGCIWKIRRKMKSTVSFISLQSFWQEE